MARYYAAWYFLLKVYGIYTLYVKWSILSDDKDKIVPAR